MSSKGACLIFLLLSSSLLTASCSNHSSSYSGNLSQDNDPHPSAEVIQKTAAIASLCDTVATNANDLQVLMKIVQSRCRDNKTTSPEDLRAGATSATSPGLTKLFTILAAIEQHQQEGAWEAELAALAQLEDFFEEEAVREVVQWLAKTGREKSKTVLQKAYEIDAKTLYEVEELEEEALDEALQALIAMLPSVEAREAILNRRRPTFDKVGSALKAVIAIEEQGGGQIGAQAFEAPFRVLHRMVVLSACDSEAIKLNAACELALKAATAEAKILMAALEVWQVTEEKSPAAPAFKVLKAVLNMTVAALTGESDLNMTAATATAALCKEALPAAAEQLTEEFLTACRAWKVSQSELKELKEESEKGWEKYAARARHQRALAAAWGAVSAIAAQLVVAP